MGKYYVKVINDEFFRSDDFYSESDAELDRFWAGGNKDFGDFGEWMKDFTKALEFIDEEAQDLLYQVSKDEMTLQEAAQELYGVVRDKFSSEFGERGGRLSQEWTIPACAEFLKACKEYAHADCVDARYEAICKALEVVYKEPFINGALRGNSQGDWAEFICPKSLEPRLEYIEAVVFATGTSIMVSADAYDSFEEAEEADDYYYDYIARWRDDDIKKYVAEQQGCGPEDVEVAMHEE